jgi:hypothetical protein
MPLPPPQSFVRRHHRRATAISTRQEEHEMNYSNSNRSFSHEGSNIDSTSVNPDSHAHRATYNRLVGQRINDVHEQLHSSAQTSRWAHENLEWVLNLSPNYGGDNQSEYLRRQVLRVVTFEESGPPGMDLLEFPDQNEVM